MFDINSCYDSFATEPNSAYFWSGLGTQGADIAADIAANNNGVTLEMVMEQNKNSIIAAGFPYNEDLGGFYFTRDNIGDWEAASNAFAKQASGEVHAVLGDKVSDKSVWKTNELPTLSENNKVNKVIAVDPITGTDKDVLLNKKASNVSTSTSTSSNVNSQNVVSTKGGGSHAPPITATDTERYPIKNDGNNGKATTNNADGFYNAKVSPTNNSSDVTQGINKPNTGFNM